MIPRGSVKRISHLGGRMLGLNPKGQHIQQSWEFTKFLVSPDVFFTFHHNQYPAQKSLLVLAGLQSIQRELYEAARVDGASESRLLIHITLPQLRPVLTVVALLTTIWTFNNFVYVWLATGGGPGDFTQVLATRVFITAFTDYRLGAAAAIGVFMSLIMLVFAIVYFALVFRQPAER